MSETIYDVIIIGAGPAGASAALYTARAGHSTLVIDKGISSGALGVADKIHNYPGIIRPMKGEKLLKTIRKQALKFGAKFHLDKVIGLDLVKEIKKVYTSQGEFLSKALIISTGAFGRKANKVGEAEFLGRGVSYCATCDGAFYKNKIVAVVGNNDEAAEELIFLTKLVKKIYFILPSDDFRFNKNIIAKIDKDEKIIIKNNSSLEAIKGKNSVKSIVIRTKGQEEEIKVDGVFIYLSGNQYVSDFVMGQFEVSPLGCVLVNKELETTVPGVFAAGDLICSRVKQAVVASADGVVAAISVDKYLSGSNFTRLDWKHE